MNTKFIIIDGPDDSGKTTLMEELGKFPYVSLFKYPKKIDGELFKISTKNDFEILKMCYPLFDNVNTYVIDRAYMSNIVYDSILRNEDTGPSVEFRKWFKDNFKVCEIILTRNKINKTFEDDNIKIESSKFNEIIDMYETIGKSYKLLEHYPDGSLKHVNTDTVKEVTDICKKFIYTNWMFV